MKKVLAILIGACLLIIISGCSGMSKASSDQPEDTNIESKNSSFDWEQITQKHGDKKDHQSSNKNQQVQGIVPISIKIPSINVKADVIKKGIVKKGKYKGHMGVPHNAVQTAWYKLGPKPGEKGSAVIAGHVDYNGVAVFYNLEDLQAGDLVHVTGKNGTKLTFKVFKKKVYPMNDVPTQKVFGYTPARVLRLLTCTGPFNEKKHTHIDRLVVSTKLVSKE